MSILAVTLLAATTATPVHTIEHTQDETAYTVSYVAHVDASARQLGSGTATHRGLQRCEVSGLVTVERRISTASGEAISAMVPGESRLSQTRAGRCVNRASMEAGLVAERSADIRAHLASTAEADHAHLAATIRAARSLALR